MATFYIKTNKAVRPVTRYKIADGFMCYKDTNSYWIITEILSGLKIKDNFKTKNEAQIWIQEQLTDKEFNKFLDIRKSTDKYSQSCNLVKEFKKSLKK